MSYFGKFWHITNKEKGGQNAPPLSSVSLDEKLTRFSPVIRVRLELTANGLKEQSVL